MQPEFAREMIDIIIAAIIYISAFSMLMRELIGRAKRRQTLNASADMPPAALSRTPLS